MTILPIHVGAAHEAGHATVAGSYGWPIVRLVARQDGSGYCENVIPQNDTPGALYGRLVVAMGGIAGELAAGYIRPWSGSPDLRDADELAHRLTPGRELDAVRAAIRDAYRILMANRAEHRRLAISLLGVDRAA